MVVFHYVEARFIYNRYALLAGRLFDSYMNSPYWLMVTKNSAEVLRNVTQETGFMIKYVMAPILKLTMDTILITATLTLLMLVNPLMTVAAVLMFALSAGGFLKLVQGRIQDYGCRVQKERMVLIQIVTEGLGGLKDIRILQRAGWFSKRFQGSIERFTRAQVFQAMTKHATKPVLETVAVAGMMSVALALHWQGRSVESIIPLLALFGAAAMRLLPTMREVVDCVNGLRYYGYSVHPVYDEFRRMRLLETSPTPVELSPKPSFCFEREIRFNHVSFCYAERDVMAVDQLSLSIATGEAVGLIGPSGAGKTTIVDLLLGLLEPSEGTITIDGVNIHANLENWLHGVGYVPQFIFLIDNTLRRNIALGLPDEEIDEVRLQTAIEASQLTETIRNLPKGVDTVVGERGVRLSGGQRQRIGIARALYGDPAVLILDEATSALDHETEKYVISSIERLKGKRTIIMIAHRLTTVRNCDRIFMINQGQVIDSGSLLELAERNEEVAEAGVR
jgi:ATP-binding cassette, subfamily B, bacterial PglK